MKTSRIFRHSQRARLSAMRPFFGVLGLILLLGLVSNLAACGDKSSSSAPSKKSATKAQKKRAPQSQLSESSKLVFSDDFENGTLSQSWRRGEGEGGKGAWRVVDGAVVGVDLKNDPLWLNEPLPEKVRVEFDIQALSSVGDLKVEIFGDGTNHASGYVLIYGGWTNTLDVIARLDEHGEDRKSRTTRGVMPGHTYHMAVERVDSTLHWFVNGEHFMSYEDPEPLTGEEHRYFALNVWSAPARFDNIKVYDLGS